MKIFSLPLVNRCGGKENKKSLTHNYKARFSLVELNQNKKTNYTIFEMYKLKTRQLQVEKTITVK